MSHVSGRPSLAPGGLQACEMQQTRGTGSDSSAHARSGQRRRSEQSLRPRASERPRPLGAALGAAEAPRTGRGRGQGCGWRGRRPCGAEESESRGRRQGPGVWGRDTAPRWGPSPPGKPEPGGLLGPAFPPSPHPRPPGPHKPSVQRSTAQDAVLPSPPPAPPGGPLRPPPPPGSSLTTPGHLSQVSSLTPAGSGPPRPPKVWARPASTQSSPRAQQGLRRGRVVKLQFIPVDTEAQETGEPPCLPPKRMLTTRVSFPRPLTPQSSQTLTTLRPSEAGPLLLSLTRSYPGAFARALLAEGFAHHHSWSSKTAERLSRLPYLQLSAHLPCDPPHMLPCHPVIPGEWLVPDTLSAGPAWWWLRAPAVPVQRGSQETCVPRMKNV